MRPSLILGKFTAIVVLKGVAGSEAVEAALQEYEKVRDKYNAEYVEQVQTHAKTDRQKEIWIEWPDYLKIVEHLKENVSSLKSESWTPKQKQQLRQKPKQKPPRKQKQQLLRKQKRKNSQLKNNDN